MLKRILTLAVVTTLLAGFYLFPAEANNEKLQRILQITGLPSERSCVIGGEPVTLKARLDRDMLVYGLPSDTPNNDWKTEADGVTTSWQEANGIDLGHPGKQEPRYLGRTQNLDPLASDYFPDDAPNHVAPARRDMIAKPWKKGLSNSSNKDTISDYSWGLIVKALETYHERVGYLGPGNGFASNPAFQGRFNKDTLKDYFLVMAEPQPGLAGAVRHWHYRHDLGGVWYDPIFVRWDILPNFIVESIDPGTQKAEAGKTYTGKVVLKAKPDASFTSDPVTGQLFEAMGLKLELTQDYVVPFGVAVNGSLVPVKNFQTVSGLENIYQYKVPAGTTENKIEFTFDWAAPANLNSGKITLGAAVNTVLKVLPEDVWGYMDWSEITNIDNAKIVEVPTDAPNLVALRIDPGVSGEAEPGARYTGRAVFRNDSSGPLHNIPVAVYHREYGAILKDGAGQEITTADFGPGEIKEFTFQFTAPDFNTWLTAYIDTPPLPDTVRETNEADNKITVNVPVRFIDKSRQGDKRLHLQAISKGGNDRYGNYLEPREREPFTAKWTDTVHATLTVDQPTPPQGSLDWWEITWAEITYPRQNPDFMFGSPYEPLPGDLETQDMEVPGRGLEDQKQAKLAFPQIWSMAGFPVHHIGTGEILAEFPQEYPISVQFQVRYQYSYIVCEGDPPSCWVVTETASYTSTAVADLLVNGAGTVFIF